MHERRTSLCTDCGGRQPAAPRCARCDETGLADLADAEEGRRGIERWHARWVEREAKRMYRSAGSAKKGLAGFFGGIGLTLGGGFWFAFVEPALAVWPLSMAVAAGAVGLGWYWRRPRSLVGIAHRKALDEEVALLRREAVAPMEPLPLPTGAAVDGAVVLRGEVLATGAEPALFGHGQVLLERVAGSAPGGVVDDARVTPFELRIAPDRVIRVEPQGWVLQIPCPTAIDSRLDEPQRRFLDARGAQSHRGELQLRIGCVVPGDEVTVTGRLEERIVPGGYRGARKIEQVAGPYAVVYKAR